MQRCGQPGPGRQGLAAPRRQRGPAAWPGSVGRQRGPAAWAGSVGRQRGPAAWAGSVGRQRGPAAWGGCRKRATEAAQRQVVDCRRNACNGGLGVG